MVRNVCCDAADLGVRASDAKYLYHGELRILNALEDADFGAPLHADPRS